MKNSIYNFFKITLGCLFFLSSSCKKSGECTYDTSCVEKEPSGYSVGTMASDFGSSNRVGTIFKTLHNSLAPIGNDWNDAALGANKVTTIFPKYWVSDSIGQVFGIALDHSGGIYLSATDIYQYDNLLFPGLQLWSSGYGPAGASGIYYTNYNTPNITVPLVKTFVPTTPASYNTVGTAMIPNTGGGLGVGNSIGNIAYDFTNNQLFATNLEDGRIYRINPTTGVVLSIFDPFILDNATLGMTGFGEQLWGIGVLTRSGTTSVYFARTTATLVKEIWSIPLTSTGEFAATNSGGKLFTDIASSSLIQISPVPVSFANTPSQITDIAFSSTGKMLLAERGAPHKSKVFEYIYSGSSWIPSNNFYVGGNVASLGTFGQNSAGGVDYSNREVVNGLVPNFLCNDIVWATGNFMPTKLLSDPPNAYPNFVYGAQGMSSAGNSSTVSNNAKSDLYIDYDGNTTTPVKGKIGDIEFFDSNCLCK
jgi:hypothetical protein